MKLLYSTLMIRALTLHAATAKIKKKIKSLIFSSSVPVHFEFFLVKKLTAASTLEMKDPQSTLLSSGPILYHRRLT